MARPKPWLARLPLILQTLEASDAESYARREVQEMFGVGRSAANELMNVVGMSSLAGTGAVKRSALLEYLKHSREAQDAMAELARRRNLASKIQEAEADCKLRRVILPVTSADEWCSLADLPNVTIEDGVLRVVFSSPLELMGDLFRFAKAVGNDWDGFVRVAGAARRHEGAV